MRCAGCTPGLPAVCEPLAKQYGGTIYPDLDTMLRASDVEAVVIATPHPSHADLAIRALEAGKHVLCEKPMATSLSDAVRIEQAAARSQQVFMALPFDRSPAMEEAKRLIDSGAIGRVSMADAVLAHRGPKHAPWFFDVQKAHWGVLADLGVYMISQLTYLFGPAHTVRGKTEYNLPRAPRSRRQTDCSDRGRQRRRGARTAQWRLRDGARQLVFPVRPPQRHLPDAHPRNDAE